MRMTVQYLAQIRRAVGHSIENIDTPDGVTLRDLLRLLGERHDAGFRAMILDDAKEPRPSLLFFVGDEHADLSRPLCEGDAVTILTPMAGG